MRPPFDTGALPAAGAGAHARACPPDGRSVARWTGADVVAASECWARPPSSPRRAALAALTGTRRRPRRARPGRGDRAGHRHRAGHDGRPPPTDRVARARARPRRPSRRSSQSGTGRLPWCARRQRALRPGPAAHATACRSRAASASTPPTSPPRSTAPWPTTALVGRRRPAVLPPRRRRPRPTSPSCSPAPTPPTGCACRCDTAGIYSCGVGSTAVINSMRWLEGADAYEGELPGVPAVRRQPRGRPRPRPPPRDVPRPRPAGAGDGAADQGRRRLRGPALAVRLSGEPAGCARRRALLLVKPPERGVPSCPCPPWSSRLRS